MHAPAIERNQDYYCIEYEDEISTALSDVFDYNSRYSKNTQTVSISRNIIWEKIYHKDEIAKNNNIFER